ncbi:MAG: hypothetical protein PWQ41_1480 [Bacillota bacterium]|nr:hypothetical protein [Bacillota bacterium]MDK2925706.1 hypothetical protein [Bacillota bacterium]MDK2959997.1 hypothetical protein [Bacillota bacterium]
MNAPRQRVWLGIILVGLLLAGAISAWKWVSLRTNEAPSPVFLTGPNTRVVEEVTYDGCGHVVRSEKELPRSQQGLNLDQLSRLYPAWNVTVSEGNLRLTTSQPGLCPACKGNLFVGLDGDEVTVFYGTPGGPKELKERTGISAAGLPEEALLDLKAGIPIESQEQLSQVLEGLMN